MKGMGPSDTKILLGDYSLAKRPRMAVPGGPTRAARRRARQRLQDKLARKSSQPATTMVSGPANIASAVLEPDQLPVQAPVTSEPDQPPVRSFERMVYLAMEEASDDDLIPDIGSDGSERSQEDGWEPPVLQPRASFPPLPAPSPVPPPVVSPDQSPAVPQHEDDDELVLSIGSDDAFSDDAAPATPPRRVQEYDPSRWDSPVRLLTRAQQLDRLFATPSPERKSRK